MEYRKLLNREFVTHGIGEFIRGKVHINRMERAYVGTFHKISPKHITRYVQEFTAKHIRDAGRSTGCATRSPRSSANISSTGSGDALVNESEPDRMAADANHSHAGDGAEQRRRLAARLDVE